MSHFVGNSTFYGTYRRFIIRNVARYRLSRRLLLFSLLQSPIQKNPLKGRKVSIFMGHCALRFTPTHIGGNV